MQSHDRAINDLQRSCNRPCLTNEAKTQTPRSTLIEEQNNDSKADNSTSISYPSYPNTIQVSYQGSNFR